MTLGHIYVFELFYPVAFTRVNIYLYWIAKDTGITIV